MSLVAIPLQKALEREGIYLLASVFLVHNEVVRNRFVNGNLLLVGIGLFLSGRLSGGLLGGGLLNGFLGDLGSFGSALSGRVLCH